MARNLKRYFAACAFPLCLLVHVRSASALGLVEAYESALQNDPTYIGAVHENEAGRQNRQLGLSNLLPQVSASYGKYKNRADITEPNFLGQEVTGHPVYDSKSTNVSLRQPLVNLDGVARYLQGKAQAEYSDAVFSSKEQDLLVRLVGAYADAKYAEDQLALIEAQRNTLDEQKRVNERMFQLGEGTKTDTLETQARYDIAEAQLLEAKDNLINARNSLAAIVGMDISELDMLRDDFRVRPMQPATFEEWRAIAMERNPDIAAQRKAVDIARQEVNKAYAGHAPRVDLVASYSKGLSETLTTLNQDSTNRTIGVQVNIPIYSGGAVYASSKQAVANLEKAKSDLDARTSQVVVELRKQYNLTVSSASKIDAMMKAVNSARVLVEATRQSVKGGVRINLDVLNAQQQLYTSLRDLAQARYSYLVAYLRLHAAAGTLNGEQLHNVASYFVKPAESMIAPAQTSDLFPNARKPAAANATTAQAASDGSKKQELSRQGGPKKNGHEATAS